MDKTLLGLLALLLCLSAFAGKPDKIRTDPAIVKGKLANGLTYYIKSNPQPQGKIHLRLIVNAGSTSESDSQQGLAHFLEHMAFKGSANFPPGTLIPKLEETGVKLGRDLNAYTKTDETVYYLNMAADKYLLGLQVIRDWAGGLLLDSLMIEQERNVIREELRLGQGVTTRMREKYYPVLLAGSPYPARFVIGKEEIISTFPQEELRKFYQKCYSPDRMAVVAIGDMDQEILKQELERLFNDIPSINSGSHPLPDVQIPEHRELKTAIITDPEATSSVLQIFYKHQPARMKTQADFRLQLKHALYAAILNMRLEEITGQPDAPFTEAESGYSSFNRGCDVYSGYARVIPGRETNALQTLLYEDKRMSDHGVNPSEMKRARRKILSGYEHKYTDRTNIPSGEWADNCQIDFLYGEPAISPEDAYRMTSEMLSQITATDVKELCKQYFSDKNQVIILTAPQGKTYPSETEFQELADEIRHQPTVPYDDGNLPEELMSQTPQPGEILKEILHEDSGITEWLLSNGARILLKPTDFNNTIIFKAVSKGGYSRLPEACDSSAMIASELADNSGVAGMSPAQMRKILTGSRISVTPGIGKYEQTFSGYFTEKDMKDFFQLLYLYQTAPEFDTLVYQRLKTQHREEEQTYSKNPDYYFSRKIDSIMTPENDYSLHRNSSVENTKNIYLSLLGNPAGMIYAFAGNFNPEEIKPYILSYPGEITPPEAIEQVASRNKLYPKTPAEYIFYKGQENKVSVQLKFVKEAEWDEYLSYCLNIYTELLSSRLFRALREELGGVYGVQISDRVGREKEDAYALIELSFGTNTEMWRLVANRAIQEMQALAAIGPSQDELERVKKKRQQSYSDNLRNNRVWVSRMLDAARYGDSPGILIKRGAMIDRLTTQDIKTAAARYLDINSVLSFILLPENNL